MPDALSQRTLSCGMPLLVEPMSGVRSVALTWLLPVGSGHDPAERQGRATMLSEMIFRGAGALDSRAQADALDKLGLARGAEVGGQFLRLSATMLADRVDAALALLVDIVLRPRLEEAALEPTRALALQALAGLEDQPQERAGIVLAERHNPIPLNRSGLGNEAGLKAMTQADLAQGWSRHVRPQGSILALAGAVNADAVARRMESLLKDWSGAAPGLTLSTPATRGGYHHESDEAASQVHIYLAHEAPPEPDADAMLERMANAVLSGGTSCRLFTEVREKRGLCYSVSSGYTGEKTFGKVTAYVGTTPDKAQESLDVLRQELARIGTPAGKVTADEFARAVVRFKTSLVFAGESTGARASSLASDLHRLGRPRTLEEVARQIDAVTLEQLNGYLARRRPGQTTVVTLGPKALTTR